MPGISVGHCEPVGEEEHVCTLGLPGGLRSQSVGKVMEGVPHNGQWPLCVAGHIPSTGLNRVAPKFMLIQYLRM